MASEGFEVVMPKVLVVPVNTPCPAVSGASVYGQLNISGNKLCYYTGSGWYWISGAYLS